MQVLFINESKYTRSACGKEDKSLWWGGCVVLVHKNAGVLKTMFDYKVGNHLREFKVLLLWLSTYYDCVEIKQFQRNISKRVRHTHIRILYHSMNTITIILVRWVRNVSS